MFVLGLLLRLLDHHCTIVIRSWLDLTIFPFSFLIFFFDFSVLASHPLFGQRWLVFWILFASSSHTLSIGSHLQLLRFASSAGPAVSCWGVSPIGDRSSF